MGILPSYVTAQSSWRSVSGSHSRSPDSIPACSTRHLRQAKCIVFYCGRVFRRSYLHRQVSPPETLVVRGGTTWARKWTVILTESCDFHAYTFGFFYMPQICDMGQTALLPFRRKACSGKIRKASDGFEPANLGTKGQHATSRPPKPLIWRLTWNYI